MPCTDNIFKNIVSNCTTTPIGGLEVKAWVMDRADVTVTPDATVPNLITDITLASGAQAWTIEGVKNLLNSGHDAVIAEDRPTRYQHFFSFQAYEVAAEAMQNIDQMDDIVVVVERKNKGVDGDGSFVILGMENGLWKTTDTLRDNDIDGVRNLEFQSMEATPERFGRINFLTTDYEATKAALEALETPAA